mgnify:CR=1 FL=1
MIEAKDSETGLLPGGRIYDFQSMQVGDGMFCDTAEKAKAVIASAHYYAKKNGIDFKLSRRAIHGGYRVWRSK